MEDAVGVASIMPAIHQRLKIYSRFVKLEHTLFSIPLLLSGALLAGHGMPNLRLCLLIICAGFGARTAAFAMNRMMDRHIVDCLFGSSSHRDPAMGMLHNREIC